jgi:hypothetical protein
MGCGESKHDVASGNVVRNSSKRSGSKKGGYDNLPSEKPTAGDSSAAQDKINQKAAEIIEAREDEILKEAAKVEEKFKEVKEEKKEDAKSIPSVKESTEKIKVAEEIPKEEKKEDDILKAEVSEKAKEKETTIAEIITEGISEKSEYNTPVAKPVETPKLKDVVVEEPQKEESGKLKEEIPVKEEKVSAEEGKASKVVAEEEKPSTTIAEEAKVSPVVVEAEKASIAVTEEPNVSTVVVDEEKPSTVTLVVEEKVSPSNDGINATPAPAPATAAKEETATETAAVDSKTH